MTRRKKWWLLSCAAAVPLLAVISYFTTFVCASGSISPGDWVIKVLDSTGKPVSGAKLTLDIGKYDPSATYIFQNYKGPGSIISDAKGVITLKNETPMPFGIECWELFWIFPIMDNKFLVSRYVLVSAPGYETVALSPREIREGKELVVTLKKGGISPRPDK